jgi:protein-S-isoprenylcysteine O-methyltransferase Ste14
MPRRVRRTAFIMLKLGALFLSAGRLDWMAGWVYVATFVASSGIDQFAAARRSPGLSEARGKWRRADTKPFDRIFLRLYLPLTIMQLVVSGLDAVRFRWSAMPVAATCAGVAMFAVSSAIVAWAMAVNRFAETTVRIQADRGHTVVKNGPYQFCRHPMYVGFILKFLGTSLILRSVWGLAIGAVIAGLFTWRTAMEDRTLRRELAGYEEFTRQTRYRLAPGVW